MSRRPIQRQVIPNKVGLINHYGNRCVELLHMRNNLSREDLDYVAETVAKLRDDRLKECIATLIGWGDDERAELETLLALGLEVMKMSNQTKLREAVMRVSLRHYTKELRNGNQEAVGQEVAEDHDHHDHAPGPDPTGGLGVGISPA